METIPGLMIYGARYQYPDVPRGDWVVCAFLVVRSAVSRIWLNSCGRISCDDVPGKKVDHLGVEGPDNLTEREQIF